MHRLVISPSSYTLWQECKNKFYFRKLLRLSPSNHEPVYMDRGTFVHLLLAMYYRAIKEQSSIDRISLLQAITAKGRLLAADLEFPPEVLEKVLSSFAQYVQFYTTDWTPLEVEFPFLSHIATDSELELEIYAEGRIDLLALDSDGKKVVVDHKSLEKDRDRSGSDFYSTPTNQTRIYSLVTGVPTIVINKFGLQTSLKPHEKFGRPIIHHMPDVLEEWKEDFINDCREMYLRLKDVGETRIDSPEFKLHRFPRNDSQCPFCMYRTICNSGPEMKPWKIRGFFSQEVEHDVFEEEEK